MIVDALKDKYSLPLLLEKLEFSKSSYYYQEKCLRKPDKYLKLRERVREIFYENKGRYGYRRIWAILSFGKNAIKISEKFIKDDNVYWKYYDAVYILFHTGMRISEFCGLTINDIDLV